MSQLRPKGERVGEIAAKAAVQLLFSTGKNFTVDGLREKLREFFRQEVRAELRAVGGAQQCGTHYRAAVLQPAARPCRPSAPNYQRGGFASHYGGPQQGLGRIFKRTDSREREFWTHDRDARSARLHRL